MTQVVHFKNKPFNVYIGRPGRWGNPFSHRKLSNAPIIVETREEAIRNYWLWINHEIMVEGINPPTLKQIKTLKDKVLGCWCAPMSCHGHILAAICDGTTLPLVATTETPYERKN